MANDEARGAHFRTSSATIIVSKSESWIVVSKQNSTPVFFPPSVILTPLLSHTGFLTKQAEDFDVGGEGVAYHDNTTKDEGATNYRKV